MNIDFEKIKTDCPKGYELFVHSSKNIELRVKAIGMDCICFCDIVDFFDSQGIIVVVDYTKIWKQYGIAIEFSNGQYYTPYIYKTRPEAQTETTYKAFSIYEERLK